MQQELEQERQRDASDGATSRDATEVRAERLIEAERQLSEQLDEAASDAPDGRIDLRPIGRLSEANSARKARVVGGRREGRQFVFTALVDGEERDLAVPWPDDPTDPTEPLVRIARWNGVSIDRIADVDRLPLAFDEDGDVLLYLPPARVERDTEVVLPGGRSFTWQRVSVGSRIKGAFAWGTRLLSRTPALAPSESVSSSNGGYVLDPRAFFLVHGIATLLVTDAAVGLSLAAPLTSLMALFGAGVVLIFVLLLPTALLEFSPGVDFHDPEE